jgi:16S rRNA (uracil1498-N3)-methyltransferase
MVHRFFVAPEVVQRRPVVLGGEQARRIRQVLRMRPGERVILLDNRGWAYEAGLLSYEASGVLFEILQRRTATGEPRIHITLCQAALKGERFAWVLQKGTEVGVSRFVPMICERNVVAELTSLERKRERWERIIQEAAEQSARARLPEVAPVQTFESLVQVDSYAAAAPAPVRLVPWEEEHSLTLRQGLARCNLGAGTRIEIFVGPEGGFTADEVGLAERCGALGVSLGPRILRSETAGVVAAAAILYEAGEL